MAALEHSAERGSVLTAPEQPPHGELLRGASSRPGLTSARECGQPAGGGRHRDAASLSRRFISIEAHFAARMALTSYIQPGLSQLKTSLISHLRPSSPPSTLSLCVSVFMAVFSPQCHPTACTQPRAVLPGGSQSWQGLEKLQNLWSCLSLMRTLDQRFPNLGVGTRPLELGAGPSWACLGQGP